MAWPKNADFMLVDNPGVTRRAVAMMCSTLESHTK